jgi:pseudouridylate synthase
MNMQNYINLNPKIRKALNDKSPIVALESALITHGLPYPDNVILALELEEIILEEKAVPATIGVIEGKITIGLEKNHIDYLAESKHLYKIGSRDLAPAIISSWSGGTTVSSTIRTAISSGIRVFSTGGIGGVHREAPFDVSSDLIELSRNPMIVVCAGVKSILDLQSTFEYLETMSIPVIGLETDEIPAFYSVHSGYKASAAYNYPDEIVKMAKIHWELGSKSAVLVVVAPPKENALPFDEINSVIQLALSESKQLNITGKDVTPFLLQRVNELTGGASKQANLSLLRNNARMAAKIAVAFSKLVD